MPVTGSDIRGLIQTYRGARADIDKVTDSLERDIGLAALRLEAIHTCKHLNTTAQGIDDGDVALLKGYVADLTGGEGVEVLIATLDAQAKKFGQRVLSSAASSASGGALVGVLATIVGVVTQAALTAQQFGAWLFTALITGGSVGYAVIRAGAMGGQVTQNTFVKSFDWAERLGQAADSALTNARRLQVALFQRAGGGPWTEPSFPSKVRSRAKLIVGVGWLLMAVGALLVGIGFVDAATDYFNEQSEPVEFPTV